MSIASPENRFPAQSHGFTLIELLAVVSVIAVLLSLSIAGIGRVTTSSRAAKGMSNLKQIYATLLIYGQENENRLPPVSLNSALWCREALAPYLPLRPDGRENRLFICPNARFQGFKNSDLSRTYSATECMIGFDPVTGNIAYTYGYARPLNTIRETARAILAFDGKQQGSLRYSKEVVSWDAINGAGDLKAGGKPTYIDYRHNGRAHFLFGDGHIESWRPEDVQEIKRLMWRGQ